MRSLSLYQVQQDQKYYCQLSDLTGVYSFGFAVYFVWLVAVFLVFVDCKSIEGLLFTSRV